MRTALISIAAALATSLSGAAIAQGRGETVKVQDWPGTGNMLLRVAIAKGLCDKHGIRCERQPIANAPLGLQALMAKSIDIAMPAMEVQITAVQRGARLKAIGGAIVTNAAVLVVRSDAGVGRTTAAALGELKGKKIAVPIRNGAAEWISNMVIAQGEVKPEDVTYVATGSVPNSMNALRTGQVDAVVHVEPTAATCVVEKWCRVVWRGSTDTTPPTIARTNGAQIVHVVREEQLAEIPHVIQAYVNAIREAETFIQNPAHFAEVVRISEQFFKLEGDQGAAVTAEALRSTLSGYKAGIDRAAVKGVVDFMSAAGQMEKPVEPASLVWDKAP